MGEQSFEFCTRISAHLAVYIGIPDTQSPMHDTKLHVAWLPDSRSGLDAMTLYMAAIA